MQQRYSLKTGYIKQTERKARRLAGTVEEFISEVRQEPHIIRLSGGTLSATIVLVISLYSSSYYP